MYYVNFITIGSARCITCNYLLVAVAEPDLELKGWGVFVFLALLAFLPYVISSFLSTQNEGDAYTPGHLP